MALLFFKSKERVLEWMDEIIEDTMEENKEDCDGNPFDLECCEASKKTCWWLVRKDGAQMGHGISSLAMAVNEVVQAQRYQYPDFTVYSIWQSDDGGWKVNW